MATVIRPAYVEHVEEYRLEFESLTVPGAGASFPCDAAGIVDLATLPPAALENLCGILEARQNHRPTHTAGRVRDCSRDIRHSRVVRCDRCGGEAEFSRYCGAEICNRCDAHVGLARCYCGWAASGGDGRRQLVEYGEVIDEE